MNALRVEVALPLPIAPGRLPAVPLPPERVILLLALRDPAVVCRDLALPDLELLLPFLDWCLDLPFAISSSDSKLDAMPVE